MQNNYPHITKDCKGNTIHYKSFNGSEFWWKYDSNNNCIHFNDSDGYEIWREYDSNNNCIHYKDTDGDEYWYDSEGKMISNPNEIKELTLEEIAKHFNIPVKNLRIKD